MKKKKCNTFTGWIGLVLDFTPKAPKNHERKWLQTVPGKSWWIVLRMYGPEEAWIKQTWRPGEVELVK